MRGNGSDEIRKSIADAEELDRQLKDLNLKLGVLANLKRGDAPPAYYALALRNLRKKTGIPIKQIEASLRRILMERDGNGGADDAEAKVAARDEVLAIGREGELWHDADLVGYATVQHSKHYENYRIRSSGFRRYLISEYLRRLGRLPGSQAVSEAVEGLEAMAAEGRVHEPFVRAGAKEQKVYLDLGLDDWRAVEIDENGWRIIENPPVKFLRPAGLRPLPIPVGGSRGLARLRELVNFQDENDLILFVAWLVAALRAAGPYPILVAVGEQGTAKTWLIAIARRLVDPSKLTTGSMPQSEEDLAVASANSHIQAFDNLSRISSEMADALCRLSTGGGVRRRKRFTDEEETLISVKRPIALNGIIEIGGRGDLAERALVLRPPPIRPDRRMTETELEERFASAAPEILGALLSGLSRGLRDHAEVAAGLTEKSRMADFESLMAAAAPAFGWGPEKALDAYRANRKSVIERVIEADSVASAIQKLVSQRPNETPTGSGPDADGSWWNDGMTDRWTGSMTRLLGELTLIVSDEERREKTWPRKAATLSGQIMRAAPALRAVGINIQRHRDSEGRVVEIGTAIKNYGRR